MESINITLQRIIHFLLINSSFIENIGLLHGKMGIAIFLFRYARLTKDKVIEDYAGELIDEICEEINTNTPFDFENGLLGLAWGFRYLASNRFIEIDSDDVLLDIDTSIDERIKKNPILSSTDKDFLGYGLYYFSRINSHDKKMVNKDRKFIFYLADISEKIIEQNQYFEFNYQQASVTILNYRLWSISEMQRLELLPSSKKKVLKYFPDQIFNSIKKYINVPNMYILQNLMLSASELSKDLKFKDQYTTMNKKIANTLKHSIANYTFNINDLITISLNKLLFNINFNHSSYEIIINNNITEIINNKEYWTKLISGVNDRTIGLIGFTGIGLSLLHNLDNSEIQY